MLTKDIRSVFEFHASELLVGWGINIFTMFGVGGGAGGEGNFLCNWRENMIFKKGCRNEDEKIDNI